MPWSDRKSTRLNSSHLGISYAVFCLKKTNSTSRPSARTLAGATTPRRGPAPRRPTRRAAGPPAASNREVPSERRALLFFFFNDTATTEIYTLSLHDALPIYPQAYYYLGPFGLLTEYALN